MFVCDRTLLEVTHNVQTCLFPFLDSPEQLSLLVLFLAKLKNLDSACGLSSPHSSWVLWPIIPSSEWKQVGYKFDTDLNYKTELCLKKSKTKISGQC